MMICLNGASFDTGNLGVSALCHSVLAGIGTRRPEAQLVYFDHGNGTGRVDIPVSERRQVAVERCGARLTRRIYRPESFQNISWCARLGGLGNAAARRLLGARVVLDVSGGDSFTDMYGPWRFRAVTTLMEIALRHGRPLVLLPQTYGPFLHRRTRQQAERIVRRAAMCWARDARSFETLRGLLGNDFDDTRHRLGVDVAFELHAREPRRETAAWSDWLDRGVPLVGFNVSGLVLNRPDEARRQFNFRADYRECVLQVLNRLLAEPDLHILLIPHVQVPLSHRESDSAACRQILRDLGNRAAGRVAIAGEGLDQCEIKWLISRCTWFCGTRMHATIAALSSGIPAASIAYSSKTAGAFATCGLESAVADPRSQDTDEVVTTICQAWRDRMELHSDLERRLPQVRARACTQLDEVCGRCDEPAA